MRHELSQLFGTPKWYSKSNQWICDDYDEFKFYEIMNTIPNCFWRFFNYSERL